MTTDKTKYSFNAGDVIGQYRVIKPLGKGGMGEVYLVEHSILSTQHALKLLPEDRSKDSVFVSRFHDEARVMANLQYEGIVHVANADESNGRHYLVMDFVGADGKDKPYDLEEALSDTNDGCFDPADVARLAMQICVAVQSAHEKGVIHRDLKPANILLTSRDISKADVRVADFGLARLIGEDWLRSQIDTSVKMSLSLGGMETMAKPASQRSSTGSILGTYEYMSPEQREGGEVDARSDIFALGVMLYRMITGKRLVGRAKAASKIVEGLDDRWDDLIDSCLEEDSTDRPDSMDEVSCQLSVLPGSSFVKATADRQSQERKEAKQREREEQERAEAEQRIQETLQQAQVAEEKKKKKTKPQRKTDITSQGKPSFVSIIMKLLAGLLISGCVGAIIGAIVGASLPSGSIPFTSILGAVVAGILFITRVRKHAIIESEKGAECRKQKDVRKKRGCLFVVVCFALLGLGAYVAKMYTPTEKTTNAQPSSQSLDLNREREKNDINSVQKQTPTHRDRWQEEYKDKLILLQKDLQQSGVYEEWFAVEKEENRFNETGKISSSDIVQEPQALASLQRKYAHSLIFQEGQKSEKQNPSNKQPPVGLSMSLNLGSGVKMEFVRIEALRSWVGKYEVTNEEYRRFKKDHDSRYYKVHSLNGDRQPVVYVSYDDAVTYAAWINIQCADRLPKGYKVRLPDGKEWLTYAQCGDGREYPWGKNWPPKYGNYSDSTAKDRIGFTGIDGYNDGYAVTCPVEKSGKNDWDLYGVGGNVWEWTSERYKADCVLRGASWRSHIQSTLRCLNRSNSYPSYFPPNLGLGFRLVLSSRGPE